MASNSSSLTKAFSAFKSQASGSRCAPRLHLLESLRQSHLGFHVTCVEKSEYNFLAFAKQGHATAELQPHSGDMSQELFEATRDFEKPSRLVPSETGTLKDRVYFGQYKYTWEKQDFILFKASWTSTCWGRQDSLFYVLSLRSESTIKDGHCSATDALLLAVGKWTSVPHEEIYVFDQTFWDKSAELWKSIQGSSWNDVILEPKMKASLIEDVQGFFDSRQLYHQFAVPWKRGIILHGVPGNGKTISIKALINYLAERADPIPSLYVKSFQNCKGEQISVKDIFDHARKMAPCLLVFEDLDSLVSEKVRSYFLNEVDGLDSNDGILMIGSTNHLSSLDPAISKRPSRFDRKYHFKVPSQTERESYCEYWRAKLANNASVDFSADICSIIATLTDGFSYAYLKELFVMALLSVARGDKGFEERAENDWDVVSSRSDTPTEPEGSNAENGEKEEGPHTGNKVSKEVPVVDVPGNLKDNVLLRVIQKQVKVLLLDMDNTEEEQAPVSVVSGDGSGSGSGKPTDSDCSGCATCRRR